MQYIARYDIAQGRAEEYRDWLAANEDAMREHQPDGWSYLGTWFTVLGFGSYQAESRWEVDEYAALGSGFGNATLQELTRDSFQFFDFGRPGEVYLMKSATDVAIMEGS
jgi:hypothetical protein